MDGFKPLLFLSMLCFLIGCSYAGAEEAVHPVPLTKGEELFEMTDEVGNTIETSAATIQLKKHNEDFSKLSGTLAAYSSGESMRLYYGWEAYLKRVADEHEQRMADGMPIDGMWFERRSIFVRRADTSVVSFLERDTAHHGGSSIVGDVHSVFGRTIDARTGKYLLLSEVCADRRRLAETIAAHLYAEYPNAAFQKWSNSDVLHPIDAGDKMLVALGGGTMAPELHAGKATWTLQPDSVTFWFNPGALGGLREGIYFVTIPFDEVPGLFYSEYSCGADCEVELVPEETRRMR